MRTLWDSSEGGWRRGLPEGVGFGRPERIFTGSLAQNSAEKDWKRTWPSLMSVKSVFFFKSHCNNIFGMRRKSPGLQE